MFVKRLKTYLDNSPHAQIQRDARILLITYVLLILVGAVYPGEMSWGAWSDRGISIFSNTHWFQLKYIGWTDILINLFGFFPMGFLLVWGFSGKRTAAILALAGCIGFSFLLELSQTFLPMRVPSLWDYLFNLIGISVGVATGRVFKVRRFGFLLKGMGLWLSAMIVWFLAQWLYESHVLPFLPRQLNDLFGFTPTTLVDLPGGWLRAWFWIQLFLSGFSFYLLRLALLSLTRPKQNMIFCTSVTYLALLAILWRYHQTHQHIPQHTEFMLIHLLFMVIPPWGAIHQQERKPIWLLGLICSLLVLYVVSIVVPPHPYASPALPSEISRELSNIRGLGIVCTLILPFWLVTLLLIRFFEIKRKKNHVLL